MYATDQISDFDLFYYYGTLPIDLETVSDVTETMIQPGRSMFYNRSEGAGVTPYENKPQSVVGTITLLYAIINAIAYRNANVTDGQNGTIDRRVAVSQDAITVESDGQGNTSIGIDYIKLSDLTKDKVNV